MDQLPGEREFTDAVWVAMTQLFGEYGSSQASLALTSYDCERKSAVMRANLVAVNNVRAALATLTSLDGKDAAVHVLAVSGTLKALRKNIST